MADYLFAEVLQRQPEPVRRLLLRTSILERVNGPLADRLLGTTGSERILLELEDADAFVFSIDRAAVLVPLSPAVRRSSSPRVAAHGARFRPGAAPRRGRVVRGARVPDRRDPPCAGGRGLAARRRSHRPVRLQHRARRQFRDDDGAARGLSRGRARQSRAGRVPRIRRGDPAVARHRRLVHRLGGAPCVGGARRTPTGLRRHARDRADDPRPLAGRLRHAA